MERVVDVLGAFGLLGGIITGGYWLYFSHVRESLEATMEALERDVRDKVDKEEQRRVDDELRGEIHAMRMDIGTLREQQHTDSLEVVRSISELRASLVATLAEAMRPR